MRWKTRSSASGSGKTTIDTTKMGHPSGTRSTGKQYAVDPWKTTFTEGKIREIHSWVQTPSTADKKKAGNKINYVFGMGDKTLSVYDNMGTQATIRRKGSDLGAKLGIK